MTQQPPPPPPPSQGPGPAGQPVPPSPGTPQPAGLGDRFLARLVDGLLFAVVYAILLAIFRPLFLHGFAYSTGELLLYNAVLSIVSTAIYIGYYAWFESERGATIGKQVLKMKVVGPDGASNPTREQAAKRNAFQAINLITIVPVLGTVLGPIASLAAVVAIAVTINNDPVARQGWHDRFAGGTRVLKIG